MLWIVSIITLVFHSAICSIVYGKHWQKKMKKIKLSSKWTASGKRFIKSIDPPWKWHLIALSCMLLYIQWLIYRPTMVQAAIYLVQYAIFWDQTGRTELHSSEKVLHRWKHFPLCCHCMNFGLLIWNWMKKTWKSNTGNIKPCLWKRYHRKLKVLY